MYMYWQFASGKLKMKASQENRILSFLHMNLFVYTGTFSILDSIHKSSTCIIFALRYIKILLLQSTKAH